MDDGTSRSAVPGSDPPSGWAPGEVEAWTILARLITGPLLYGGIGWLLDLWLGTHFLAAVGIIGGMALSLYVVFVLYGTRESSPEPPARHSG